MADLSPRVLLDLYYRRASDPKPVYAAIPKASNGHLGHMVAWSVLRADLVTRLARRPNADSFVIITVSPPKRTT